ncbi:hypothetical protein [Microvirga terricola]|uniref:Uncharacterized protein n=1 Tax=Microvirga terricola TaxID=2719797 RepID=A0ABX0VAM4_9HYPH|nr:hypothetical protein [Microvirga terricola]NIX75451.1 hypothetical protein [Microvirga terricola]
MSGRKAIPTNHVINHDNSINVTDRNGLEMAVGDTLWLEETGRIVVNSTAWYGVNITGTDTKLNIEGKVLTQLGAIQVNGARTQINVGAMGELSSSSSMVSTIELYGWTDGALIINNYGRIVSTGTGGAIASSVALNVFNAGLISTAPRSLAAKRMISSTTRVGSRAESSSTMAMTFIMAAPAS